MTKQKKVIQFGIIGCSSIAKRVFIPSILNAKNANLHMIGSRNITKAKKFAERFSCEKFGTYEDVLNYLNQIYIDENPLLTYGSYLYYPFGEIGIEPSEYSREIIKNNEFSIV